MFKKQKLSNKSKKDKKIDLENIEPKPDKEYASEIISALDLKDLDVKPKVSLMMSLFDLLNGLEERTNNISGFDSDDGSSMAKVQSYLDHLTALKKDLPKRFNDKDKDLVEFDDNLDDTIIELIISLNNTFPEELRTLNILEDEESTEDSNGNEKDSDEETANDAKDADETKKAEEFDEPSDGKKK